MSYKIKSPYKHTNLPIYNDNNSPHISYKMPFRFFHGRYHLDFEGLKFCIVLLHLVGQQYFSH